MNNTTKLLETELISFSANPAVKEKADLLFTCNKEKIMEKICELKNKENECMHICDEEVFNLFRIFFYKLILNEAIHMALGNMTEKYNINKNILELLTERNLKKAIAGKPMLDAFSEIRNNNVK